MKYFIRFNLFLFFIVIANSKSIAQYDPSATLNLGMGHGYNALSQSVMSNAFKNGVKATTLKSNNADYLYLGSSHYNGFEEKLIKSILSNNKNNDKGKVRSFIVGTRTMYHFMMRSRELGLNENHLSDILATGIAWNWEMYHQTKASKQKVINLRNAIMTNISKDAVKNQILKLSDEDKRNWILGFMYNNSILAQTIKQTGKVSTIQKQQLAQIAKQAGVPDIASVSMK